MTEERRRVLDMLSEGKISVDEAERLLEALRVDHGVRQPKSDTFGEAFRALDGLGESIVEAAEGATRKRVTVVLDREDEASTRDDAFEVGANPRIEVRSFNGRVRVKAGEPGSIRVSAKLRNPRGVEYSAVQEGDIVKVVAKPRQRSGGVLSGLFGHHSGANIHVVVPASTNVDIVTSNGPAELRDTERGAAIQTSNGPIMVERLSGDLNGQTSNGPITVHTLCGSADLTTSNGRVLIDDGHGRFDVTTSNGPIGFWGTMEPGGRNRFSTSNGSIDMMLDGEPNLKLQASTVNGKLRCDLPGLVASVDTNQKLEGTVGKGEAELAAKTVNGAITIGF